MTAPAHVWRFDAIGVPWEIATSTPVGDVLRGEVHALVAAFDLAWSRFRDDSVVRALAAGAGDVPAPPDAAVMLALYAELGRATDGAIDPLVGTSLEALGYGPSGCRPGDPQPVPVAEVTWADGTLRAPAGALIDVGALGKGRLVDRVLALVTERLKGPVVVDGSGDMAVRGATQRVGLEHPYDPTRVIGVWELTDAALCASAANRRAWGDGLHHVIDARTGRPVDTVVATWAVCDDAMHADALASALFFEGGPTLAHAWDAAWVRMLSDGRLQASPGCPATLFTSDTAELSS